MKKNLFFVALAAVALASCASEDLVDEAVVETPEVAIDFEGETQKATRAEITGKDDLLGDAMGFKVWGWKSKDFAATSADSTKVFDGTVVTGSKSGTTYTWTYSPKKYWDKTTAYHFHAAAPADDNVLFVVGTSSAKNGALKFTNVASGLASASKDYLIDRAVKNVAINTAGTPYSAVGFDFHHTMAKIDFLLAKSSDLASTDVVKVQSITMSGWDNATGTFVQKRWNSTWNALDYSEWTLGTSVAGSVQVLSGETPKETTLNTTAAATNTNTFIMVPQLIAANTLTFTLNYTVNDEPFKAQVGKIANAQTWGTDSHITYTITVGPQAIEFTVNTVCNFDAATGADSSSVN